MHACFQTNIFDILEIFSKLHNFDIFPKRNDDKNLKKFCGVLLLKPGSTLGFMEHISFNLEAPNGSGYCDLEPHDDWVYVACIFPTPPISTFANVDPIVAFNDFATSCVTSQVYSNKISCKKNFFCNSPYNL